MSSILVVVTYDTFAFVMKVINFVLFRKISYSIIQKIIAKGIFRDRISVEILTFISRFWLKHSEINVKN